MTDTRILIVEDESIVALDIRVTLQQLGYTIAASTASGEEAVSLVPQIQPDLVLMDIRLQGEMDGIEAAEQIRARYDLPVIYLTAHSDTDTLQRARVSEPFGFLVKPFRENELYSSIEMALYKHRMEKRLRLNEERYRIIAELVSDILYALRIEPDGSIIPEWGIAGLAGLTGLTLFELAQPDALHTVVHPDDRAAVEQHQRNHRAGQVDICEFRIITRQGETRWLRDYGRPVWDEAAQRVVRVLAAVQDITERKRMEQEIQRRNQALAAIQKTTHAITSTLDMDTVLSQVMEDVRSLSGADGASVLLYDPTSDELYFAASAVGSAQGPRGIRLAPDESIVGWAMQNGQSALVSDATQDERFSNRVDGLTGYTTRALMVAPLTFKEQRIGAIEVVHRAPNFFEPFDLVVLESLARSASIAIANARLYQEQQNQMQTLQKTQVQLIHSTKMAALGRLMASLSHEINNPIQSIQTYVTLAREDLEKVANCDKPVEFLAIVDSEIDRVANIMHRMREFYRPARRTMQTTDLHPLLDSVLNLIGKELQERAITIERDWADDLPAVQANPDHLKQVFLNIALNAIDAMPDGGTFAVRTSLDQTPDRAPNRMLPAARIDFGDTGDGMSPETLARLFEPYFTTKQHGSGLGLYISYRIIESHKGQFQARSEQGKGATFSILLPTVNSAPPYNSASEDNR